MLLGLGKAAGATNSRAGADIQTARFQRKTCGTSCANVMTRKFRSTLLILVSVYELPLDQKGWRRRPRGGENDARRAGLRHGASHRSRRPEQDFVDRRRG